MNKKEIGEALKNYRAKHNYSQADLARRLFTSNITIMRWENGRTMPYRSAIEAIKSLKILPVDA